MYKIVLVISMILSGGGSGTATLQTPEAYYYETLAACEEDKAKVTISSGTTIVSLDCVPVE